MMTVPEPGFSAWSFICVMFFFPSSLLGKQTTRVTVVLMLLEGASIMVQEQVM